MSIYSGFATRQQEHKYNSLLETLVIALKKRIIKFYDQEACDENKFRLLIKKIYKKMYMLEKGKYMAPKYSSCFTDLIDALKIEVNYDSMSDASSMMSQTFSFHQDDTDGDQLTSNAKLISKKNLLQVARSNHLLDTSALSLPKKSPIQTSLPRSSTLDFNEAIKNPLKPNKIRQLQALKDVRGTMNMPKVEDYLPRKEQLQPPIRNAEPRQQKVAFRRQKYSRQDVQIQDI